MCCTYIDSVILENKLIKGVIAGNFDVIHPGYIKMFLEMEKHCDMLIVLLHSDPTIERPHKLKPITSVEERKEMLKCFRMVTDVISYTYEAQLLDILELGEFDVRFLGDDYINKPFTGDYLKIPIHYLDRSHGWSTTKFKQLIADSIC